MLYRNIRKIATGEWVDVLWTTAGVSFDIASAVHVATMATVLSLDANELEAVDGSSDARTGTLIVQPTPPVTRKEELMAIGRDNWTDAQQKELIEILAKKPGDA
jgi:hypothetical protein|tara:strand:- start:37 stop:348 length:312 start_codon:yes stop_codon:yes gene_type:complete